MNFLVWPAVAGGFKACGIAPLPLVSASLVQMKTGLVLLAVAVALVACRRRTPPAAPAPEPPPVSDPVKTTGSKTAPPSAPAAGGGGRIVAGDQNLPALNAALKAYMAKHKKAPAKLDDLATEGLVPFVPFAPPGMRYELDAARGEVKLINPMVK
jgi:hypothetical protein